MNYWQGIMNWPLTKDWKCETCGEYHGLQWGMVNGECRCINCQTQYMMRDDEKILTTPLCLLKPEYKLPAKLAFTKYHKPIDDLTDDEWEEFYNKELVQNG